MDKMQFFIGSKVIQAVPRTRKEVERYKGNPVDNNEDEHGYMVKYPDGYISWSPKEAFESAYRMLTKEEKVFLGMGTQPTTFDRGCGDPVEEKSEDTAASKGGVYVPVNSGNEEAVAITEEMRAKFQELILPLIKFINEECTEHSSILISNDGAELVDGRMGFYTEQFLKE